MEKEPEKRRLIKIITEFGFPLKNSHDRLFD